MERLKLVVNKTPHQQNLDTAELEKIAQKKDLAIQDLLQTFVDKSNHYMDNGEELDEIDVVNVLMYMASIYCTIMHQNTSTLDNTQENIRGSIWGALNMMHQHLVVSFEEIAGYEDKPSR